jgi:hypothetical protein
VNLDEAQLLDRIGRLRREDLSAVASRALQDGVDSHSLALLAGLAPAEADRPWELWKGAIKELGRTEPSFIDAVHFAVQKTAREALGEGVDLRRACADLASIPQWFDNDPPQDLRNLYWFGHIDEYVWEHIERQPWLQDRVEQDVRGKLRALLGQCDWNAYAWSSDSSMKKGSATRSRTGDVSV